MPTYDYACQGCGYAFEKMQMITAKPLKKCPKCKKNKLKRLIGGGSGIILGDANPYEGYRAEHIKLGPSKPSNDKK